MAERFGPNISWTLKDDKLTLTGTGKIKKISPKISCSILEIGEGITAIEAETFREWFGLEKVILPKSLKYIGERAFFSCTCLKEIGPLPPYNRIEKTAFIHTHVKDIKEKLEQAGPVIVDFADFVEDREYQTAYTGNYDDLDPPDFIKDMMRPLSYEEQLSRYVLEGKYNEDGEIVIEPVEICYEGLDSILVKDGIVLGLAVETEVWKCWVFLMEDNWKVAGWEESYADKYPYYKDYVEAYWVRSTMEIYEPDEGEPEDEHQLEQQEEYEYARIYHN